VTAPRSCPRCGAPAGRGRQYCAECGQRLPAPEGPFSGLAAAWASRASYPGDWIWPVLGFFVLAALGALVAIAISDGANGTPSLVATPSASLPIQTATAPPTTVPVTIQPPVTQPPPVTTKPRTTPKPHPRALVSWPRRDGYTVVLQSLPASASRTNAVRTARQALAAGLQQVGVLDSSAYSSLHPGYYVVFSGIYSSAAAAASGVSQAQAAGFRAAYARPVTR